MKIFKVVIIVLVCLVFLFIVLSNILRTKVNTYKGNNKRQYVSGLSGKKALIIYQPSLTNSTEKIVYEIADGLKDNNTNVDINYAGNASDYSQYEIIIFCSPAYANQPVEIIHNTIKDAQIDVIKSKVYLCSVGMLKNNTNELNLMTQIIKTDIQKSKKFTSKSMKEAFTWGQEIGNE